MAQHINKDDLRQIIKKMIKESVGIPSEENYYISVMVPRIKSWMDEVYQDWGGIDAVSPEALTDFSNRNDYEDSLETFAHEFNVDREELRPVFDKAIEIAHSQLKEDLLGEAKFVNQFTPYTDDEKRTNFEYLRTGFGRSPEERNPAYAAAKKAAEERRKQKEAQKQSGEVSETIRYGAERMAADNNYRMRWNEKYLQPLLDKCDAILNGSENSSVQEIVDLYKRLNTIKSSNPIRYDVRLIELQDEIKDRLEKLVEFIRQMMTNRPNESKKRVKKSEIVEAIKEAVNNQTLNCNRNMNKKQIRLTESDLKQIVKESVNKILCEAYGTPDTNTRVALNNLDAAQHYGDTLYGLKQDNGAEVPYKEVLSFNNGILKLEDDLTTIMRCDPTNPYAWKLSNYVQGMKDLSRRMINRLKMNQGEQPDENYNDSHLSRSKRMTKVQDLNGREDRGDYSGFAGWGG